MSLRERVSALHECGLLSEEDVALLSAGDHTLRLHTADKMIENVVGVLGLPVGIGLNFLINGRDYVIPLSVEEPSIVRGVVQRCPNGAFVGRFQSQLGPNRF